ncbi:hypothetical protein ACC684_28750 [Rhizobium ruizarguesonis]
MTPGIFLLLPADMKRTEIANVLSIAYGSFSRRRPEIRAEHVINSTSSVTAEVRGMTFGRSFDMEGVEYLFLIETHPAKGHFDVHRMGTWLRIRRTERRWQVVGAEVREKPAGMKSRIEIVMATVNRED